MRWLPTVFAVIPVSCFLSVTSCQEPPEPDVLIADFEQEDYGAWTATGEAFGKGPARGTLSGQMHVEGYLGDRLVNSFLGGDGPTGTLTSPAFRVARDYLTFLVGGGGYAGETCMNLRVRGEVVRTATGPNTNPGGSERLELHVWNVRDLRDQNAVLEIVDRASGGWGHINVDHIVATNTKPDVPQYESRERRFTVSKPYLVIPVRNGARKTELVLEVEWSAADDFEVELATEPIIAIEPEGVPVRRYEVELATDPDEVDWYAYFTLEAYRGKKARVRVQRATEEGFALVRQEDDVPGSDGWYHEALRPQFHFSQRVGWNNDPNGMVYLDGEWHLFFQHNPVGWNWGNMTWGHAVSTDLVTWEQLPDALFPKTMAKGDCFSGSAVVDTANTAGWKQGEQDVLVAFLTDTGAGECVAYSRDRGRTFTWYEGNPVVKHRGRDPKVIWYAYGEDDEPLDETAQRQGGHWVMAVYDEHETYGQNIALYTSNDLVHWTERSHLPGYYECPELFELPVDGKENDTRWVVYAADAQYALGTFDGKAFTPEHEGKHRLHWGAYYASQTFNNAPDGRRIQIGWARIAMPGMPFNQAFSFPHELSLRTTEDGVRMFAEPVREWETLEESTTMASFKPPPGGDLSPVSVPVSTDLLRVSLSFQPGTAQRAELVIGEERILYDVAARRLDDVPLNPRAGIGADPWVALEVLVDRPMIEVIGNEGRIYITRARSKSSPIENVRFGWEGGDVGMVFLHVAQLNSIWE
ncbi:MAG: glycoside hydrolase family 32 protein [Planctomycetes bacterium]|nr:glycoside hydrolase family 32 protein [Planctomycetota bacterium]